MTLTGGGSRFGDLSLPVIWGLHSIAHSQHPSRKSSERKDCVLPEEMTEDLGVLPRRVWVLEFHNGAVLDDMMRV